MSQHKREIAIIGGGLAGWTAAVEFARAGFDTALIAPPVAATDGRSTALLGTSVDVMRSAGVLDRLADVMAPLRRMRLIDDTRRLIRAPTVEFDSNEIGLPCFGFNVLNADLLSSLATRADELSDRLTVFTQPATGLSSEGGHLRVTLEDGSTVRSALVVGADGRRSIVREFAQIRQRTWSYPQHALVVNFKHARDHGGTSTEFHRRVGPFTQVPLPGRRSSLVWVEDPAHAQEFLNQSPDRLSRAIEEHMHSLLGAVQVDGKLQSFPLSGATANRVTAERIALIGEAAHVFPPIGAQGFNLGMRDLASLVRIASAHRHDPGNAAMCQTFETERRSDILTRTASVDLLNRSLLSGFLPLQATRAAGLDLLKRVSVFRRFALREGMVPGAGFADIASLVDRNSFSMQREPR